jgi:hypothetical protein
VSWAALEEGHEQIRSWVEQGLQVEKIRLKLVRLGVGVPYRTLHRFCVERCGFGRGKTHCPGGRRDAGQGVSGRFRPARAGL